MAPPRLSRRLPPELGGGSELAEAWQARPPRWDLSESRPDQLGLVPAEVSAPLCGPALGGYRPDPAGDLAAREFLARALAAMGRPTAAGALWLTASTSEAYAVVLKLLCDPGDTVAVQEPGYPLVAHIAALEGVSCTPLPLGWHGGADWRLDLDGCEQALAAGARVLLLTCPNNPTGHCPSPAEAEALATLARRYDVAVVVDEVFRPYDRGGGRPLEAALAGAPLAFFLGGLSKWAGLPGCKVAWIRAAGRCAADRRVRDGLDWIGDTFLCAAQAQQAALPQLWRVGVTMRRRIAGRLSAASRALARLLAPRDAAGERLLGAGGWHALVATRAGGDAHAAALAAAGAGVRVHPGYFYDLPESAPACLVVSLLTPPARLAAAWQHLEEVL